MVVSTPKEAWIAYSKEFPDEAIETVGEIDNFFVFSTRPKGTPFGVATGTTCYFVDKGSGEVSAHSVLDPLILTSKIDKTFDPITLRER